MSIIKFIGYESVLGQPEVFIQIKEGMFDDAENIASADTKKFLQGWMDKYTPPKAGWHSSISIQRGAILSLF